MGGRGSSTGGRAHQGGDKRGDSEKVRRQRALARGQLIYSDAKAEADAVIAGLIVALSAKGQPEKLSSLQERVERAVTGLAKLRNLAESQLPKLEGTKEFSDILKGAIEQLQKPLRMRWWLSTTISGRTMS